MGLFDWTEFDDMRARFCGSVRCGDELSREVFAVQLKNGQTYYGDFRPIYADDGNHYSLEIVSFGFGNEGNVGNPNPGARATFSTPDVELIRTAIERLVQSESDKPFPLTKYRQLLWGAQPSSKDGYTGSYTIFL